MIGLFNAYCVLCVPVRDRVRVVGFVVCAFRKCKTFESSKVQVRKSVNCRGYNIFECTLVSDWSCFCFVFALYVLHCIVQSHTTYWIKMAVSWVNDWFFDLFDSCVTFSVDNSFSIFVVLVYHSLFWLWFWCWPKFETQNLLFRH